MPCAISSGRANVDKPDSGGQQLFAKLDKGLKLDHNDFDMIS